MAGTPTPFVAAVQREIVRPVAPVAEKRWPFVFRPTFRRNFEDAQQLRHIDRAFFETEQQHYQIIAMKARQLRLGEAVPYSIEFSEAVPEAPVYIQREVPTWSAGGWDLWRRLADQHRLIFVRLETVGADITEQQLGELAAASDLSGGFVHRVFTDAYESTTLNVGNPREKITDGILVFRDTSTEEGEITTSCELVGMAIVSWRSPFRNRAFVSAPEPTIHIAALVVMQRHLMVGTLLLAGILFEAQQAGVKTITASTRYLIPNPTNRQIIAPLYVAYHRLGFMPVDFQNFDAFNVTLRLALKGNEDFNAIFTNSDFDNSLVPLSDIAILNDYANKNPPGYLPTYRFFSVTIFDDWSLLRIVLDKYELSLSRLVQFDKEMQRAFPQTTQKFIEVDTRPILQPYKIIPDRQLRRIDPEEYDRQRQQFDDAYLRQRALVHASWNVEQKWPGRAQNEDALLVSWKTLEPYAEPIPVAILFGNGSPLGTHYHLISVERTMAKYVPEGISDAAERILVGIVVYMAVQLHFDALTIPPQFRSWLPDYAEDRKRHDDYANIHAAVLSLNDADNILQPLVLD